MKILTANQRAVLTFLKRMTYAYTAREIADARALSPSSVQSALATLARHGCVEIKGSASTGGATWGVVRRPDSVYGGATP